VYYLANLHNAAAPAVVHPLSYFQAVVLGLLLEHPVRVALAKPSLAAAFLMVNGVVLIGAERLRRRAEIRSLAEREGLNQQGYRKLDTLQYREAIAVGSFRSTERPRHTTVTDAPATSRRASAR